MTIQERIAALRNKMQENKIDAYIVYSADPHMSEYLPEEWQERAWISGFTGSAGFVVILKDKAALWTDGRYFVQAPIELKNSEIELMKDGVDGTPNYIDWIIANIPNNGTVATNFSATSHANWQILNNKLSTHHIKLDNQNLIQRIWDNQPKPSENQIYTHPVERAGLSVNDKITAIREKMQTLGVTSHIIYSLDDVAWTLNLRGSDVDCNPVFLGFIYLTLDNTTLFVAPNKLNNDAIQQLHTANVSVENYDTFIPYLSKIKGEKILLSPNTNQSIVVALQEKNNLVFDAAPGNLMKAQKNKTELAGFRTVMERDGVAMVKFLYWLTHQAGKEEMTEYSIGVKLKSFRAACDNFVGESFGSIVGYAGNDAICHYSAKEIGSKSVSNVGSILVDSGGQYLEGTTDITRTLPLGQVTEQFKIDATLVLQGMIRLSMVKFPKGTKGVQLDAIARMPLWLAGKDYNHGTGHGVGSFMNVHEGPQNIRKDMNPQELLLGMVVSNEPGFYLENHYGIRHENLVAVQLAETTEFGEFYQFETLTICPFFKDIIVKEILSEEEIVWLDKYHQLCKEKLEKHLEGEVKDWFLTLVSPL